MLGELQLYELIQNIFETANIATSDRSNVINQLIHVSLLSSAAELVRSAGPTKKKIDPKHKSDDELVTELIDHYGEAAVKTTLIRLVKANTALSLIELASQLEPEQKDIVTEVIDEIDIKTVARLPESVLELL